jgi:hypothetical protein
MDMTTETAELRRMWGSLSRAHDETLVIRYDLLTNHLPVSPTRWTARWFACTVFRVRKWLSALGLQFGRPSSSVWFSALKHAPIDPAATPVIIWAINTDLARGFAANKTTASEATAMQRACDGWARCLQSHRQLAPVLVTDVADFSFYSRLGWLVEYVPELSGNGSSYRERKLRHLAWRYRDAKIVPLAAGLSARSCCDVLVGPLTR